MEIRIFDVARGFCAYVIADNRNTMLIDCGANAETGFSPANYLRSRGCTGIERFFVLNYDEDHLSGLPALRSTSDLIPIRVLHRNPSLSPAQLSSIKQETGPLGSGMKSLLAMLETYTAPVTSPPEFTNLEFEVFQNNYPTFKDTNNLSLVLFLHHCAISVVFTGDLEKAGWQELLRRGEFRDHLARVNVFVASHHGRESGYVKEVFDYCEPDVIIISDESKQYDTQEIDYNQHASGIPFNGSDVRRVLTTRKDGMMTFTTNSSGLGYLVATAR
jgi:beta-lactamase superfamily II metal-dependent hydrolase